MSRFTLQTDNQWRHLKDGARIDLFRLSLGGNRWLFGASLTLGGFGVGLTLWRYAVGREHGA